MSKDKKIRRTETLDLTGLNLKAQTTVKASDKDFNLFPKADKAEEFSALKSKEKQLLKDYWITKILLLADLDTEDFTAQSEAFAQKIARLEKDFGELTRSLNPGSALFQEKREAAAALLNGIDAQVHEVLKSLYARLKMTTVKITVAKDLEALKHLYANILRELKGFPDLMQAGAYITYHSGSFLNRLVDAFITYLKNTKIASYRKYTKSYFLGSDAAVYLERKGWIDLYNKLQYVYKLIGNYRGPNYQKNKELFDLFEAKYAVLMLLDEKGRVSC